MRTEPSPELIEVIDDDVDYFGDRTPSKTSRDSSERTRWAGPVAAAALLAALGYGVVSSAIESDNSVTPPNPALIDPVFYVADPPTGFSMYLAEQRGDPGTAADFLARAPAEMWATPDAHATTGAWFVVSVGTHHSTGRNSYRVVVDGTEVVVEHDPETRQSRLSFSKNGYRLEITSLGWLDRQLVRLVRSVEVDAAGLGYSNAFFVTDHKRILQADPASALEGLPVARVGYSTGQPTALAENFTITVAGDDIVNSSTVTKFALTNKASTAIGNLPAIVGQSAADPTVSIVQWRDGGRLITLRGNLSLERLGAIAQTVHPSAADDVHQQLLEQDPPSVASRPDRENTVVSGMLGDRSTYVIQVDAWVQQGAAPGYLWWIDDIDGELVAQPSVTARSPSIETFVDHGRTYVMAKVPRSMKGAHLHVNPTGLPSIVTPLYDVNPALDDLFVASVFLEPVPFTAHVTDADGTTVASWPTF